VSGDLCILNFGPDQKARLVALNKKTGEIVWEVEPPKLDELSASKASPAGRVAAAVWPGMLLPRRMLSQADKNGDQKLTKDESALWLTRGRQLDADKAGKLSQEQFTEKLSEVFAATSGIWSPGGAPPGGGQRPGGGVGSPGQVHRTRHLHAADADKDGSLTRSELKSTFENWFAEWDPTKAVR